MTAVAHYAPRYQNRSASGLSKPAVSGAAYKIFLGQAQRLGFDSGYIAMLMAGEGAALVEGRTPHQLIALIFTRLDRALAAMTTAMVHGNQALRNHYHAQAAMQLQGLKDSLDMRRGGTVAQALSEAYDGILAMLSRALIADDRSLAKAARSYVQEISEAWEAIG